MALGAKRGNILGMVMRETAMIVLAGVAVGIPAAWATSSLLKTQLVRTDIARSLEHRFGRSRHAGW